MILRVWWKWWISEWILINKKSKYESEALTACLCLFDDNYVIVVGMSWQRGHMLSIFSAPCLSQRPHRSSGVLTHPASLQHPCSLLPLCSPSPSSSACLLHSDFSLCHVLTRLQSLCNAAFLLIQSSCPYVSSSSVSSTCLAFFFHRWDLTIVLFLIRKIKEKLCH